MRLPRLRAASPFLPRCAVGVSLRRVLLATAMLGLAACGDRAEPTGQVIARVNGQEVTMRDLTSEFQAAQLTPDLTNKTLVNQVLAKIIDRKLVASQGKELGLERSPEYLAARQRADEIILGQSTVERWNNESRAPSDGEIAAFIADNPWRFRDRSLIQLAQIKTGATDIDNAELAPLKTMDDVVALLRARKVAFRPSTVVVDTAQTTPEVYRQLRASADGEPMVEVLSDGLLVSAVAGSRPAPLTQAEQRTLATNAIRSQALENRVKTLRKSAKVEYKPGFAAVAGASGSGAGASTAGSRAMQPSQPAP